LNGASSDCDNDDDDDSNAEDYWKNDYPDEDEVCVCVLQ
jgi:hypothetical protein